MTALETDVRQIRIVIADDHRMFRESLRRVLDREPGISVVGDAGDATTAAGLARDLRPDVLLLDLSMRRGSALHALTGVAKSDGQTRVIVLAGSIERRQIAEALQLGAKGLVLKQSAIAMLLKAIRAVMSGEFWVGHPSVADLLDALRSETRAAAAPKPANSFGLTPRELDIIHAVAAAYANKEIAEKLAISEKTVKHHLTNIFEKVGVSTRLELALFALHHGLSVPEQSA